MEKQKINNKELKKEDKKNIENFSDEKDLKILIEKNIEISNEILETSKYIKGFIAWRKVMSFIQLLIIIIPIILALIYVPPFLEGLMEALRNVPGVPSF